MEEKSGTVKSLACATDLDAPPRTHAFLVKGLCSQSKKANKNSSAHSAGTPPSPSPIAALYLISGFFARRPGQAAQREGGRDMSVRERDLADVGLNRQAYTLLLFRQAHPTT
jgi:hypothetical protein